MNPEYAHIGEIDDCLIEEMSELTKEICKVKRFGMTESNLGRIKMEISDVEYRLDQYKQLLEISQ